MELQVIQSKIYEIRGNSVMLDFDLAELYQVETKTFNQSVKRNPRRFPPDFMFQLNENEFNSLRSQIVTSKRGGTRYMPFAFTEQGIAMLSGILNSDIAIDVNIKIMRAFVAVRKYLVNNTSISGEIRELKERIERLESADEYTLKAVNDLSEDNRKELDGIYLALSELSIKQEKIDTPRKTITGFRSYDKETE
ncbi:hypothetical protein EZS27_008833 [termite gut metagenome]|uniref:KilA-N DNA-binding domain-containing protein n=1 Tax=termite gut metagenome TaxID=433724 RepID=A0A5J4SBS6_9ZZZZ